MNVEEESMKKKSMKKKTGTWMLIVLAIFLFFNIVSNKIQERTMAQVTVTQAASGKLKSDYVIEGNIEKKDSVPVGIEEDLVVEHLYAKTGQTIHAGDVLFTVTADSVEEKKKSLEKEAEELRLQIEEEQSSQKKEYTDWKKGYEQAEQSYRQAQNALTQAQAKQQVQEQSPEEAQGETQGTESEQEALQSARKAWEQAATPLAEHTGIQRYRLDLKEKEEKIEKLEKIQKNECKVQATVDGCVDKICQEVGQKTTGDAILLYTASDAKKLALCDFTEEQENLFRVGCKGTLEGKTEKGENIQIDNCEILSVEKKQDETSYQAQIDLEEGNFAENSAVTFSLNSESPYYEACLPLSALHVDAKNNDYVLVLSEKDTILGAQYVLKSVPITVLEKNTTSMAVQNGDVLPGDQVVVDASKLVEAGSKVRLQELSEDGTDT